MANPEITDEERGKLRELAERILETPPSDILFEDILELSDPVVELVRELEEAPYEAEIRHHWEGRGWDSFDVYLKLSNLLEDLLLSEDELDEDRVDEVDALLRKRAESYGDSASTGSRSNEDTPPIATFELASVYEALAQRIEGLTTAKVNPELVAMLEGQPIPDFFLDGRENGWDDPAVVEAATNFYLSNVSEDRLRELIGEEPDAPLSHPVSRTIGTEAWDLLPDDLKALPDFLSERLSSLGFGGTLVGVPLAESSDPVYLPITIDEEIGEELDSLGGDLSPQDSETDTTDDGEWDLAEIAIGDEPEVDEAFDGDDLAHSHGDHGHSHGVDDDHVHQILDGELLGLDDYSGEPADEREVTVLALIAEGLIYAELNEIFLQDLVAEADPIIRIARARGEDWWLTGEATMSVADLVSRLLLNGSWPGESASADEVLAHREELQRRAAIYPLDPEPEAPARAAVLASSTVPERFELLLAERGERSPEGLNKHELSDLKNAIVGHLGFNPTEFLLSDLGELLSDRQLELGRTYGFARGLRSEICSLGVELLIGVEVPGEYYALKLNEKQKEELKAAVQSYRTDEYSEEEFLKHYDSSRWPSFGVTVDLSIFTIRDGKLQVLLIERGNHPEKGKWALPGGFVNPDESLDRAARRELQEETGVDLEATGYLEQVKSYGYPGRDPRGSVVSTLYAALIPEDYLPEPEAADDAAKARFVPVEEAQGDGFVLAFDHDQLLKDALLRVRSKIEYSPMVFDFLKMEPFTIEELREVYEIVWGMRILPSDFRRRISQAQGALRPAPNARGEEPHWIRGTATRFFPPLDILEVEFLRD